MFGVEAGDSFCDRKVGELAPPRTTCIACDSVVHRRGRCRRHYRQALRDGIRKTVPARCPCGEPANAARGYCWQHYHTGVKCGAAECKSMASRKGLCAKHYKRFRQGHDDCGSESAFGSAPNTPRFAFGDSSSAANTPRFTGVEEFSSEEGQELEGPR